MGKRQIKNHLPTEIMEEILYKLPVKSLLRFKCVSKPWRSLISSKYFIKHHLKKSSNNDTYLTDWTHHKLIFSVDYYQPGYSKLGSCSLRNEPIITPNFDNEPKRGMSGSHVWIVGSCNGLVLMGVYQQKTLLLLWNPSTRKFKNIPVPSFDDEAQLGQETDLFDWGGYLYRCLFGLGYDESSDDYKIVSICRKPMQTDMYSSKTDSWKKIQTLDKGVLCFYEAKFVNRRLHWQAHSPLPSIISHSLVEGKYETLPLPKFFLNSKIFSTLKLEELGGYLCLMSQTPKMDVSVWAMMEYGKSESWTKVWTLSDFVVFIPWTIRRVVPLGLNKNGDIAVLFDQSNIVVSNGKNELRKSRLDRLDDSMILRFCVYVESLV